MANGVVQNLSRNVQENAPEIGGGMVGVGVPVALREFMDVSQGPLLTGQGDIVARLTRPSVAYGLGAGAVTGALWFMDVGPDMANDFFLAHTATAVPTGIASAILPKEASSAAGSSPSASRARRTRQPAVSDGGSEFAPAGGREGAMPEAE